MKLYELIEQTLSCKWEIGAYRKHFPIHYWPDSGHYTLPYLRMTCPHECVYSVIDYQEKKTYTVGVDEVVLSVPNTPMQVHQHKPGMQSYVHLIYTIMGAFDPWTLFRMPRTYKGKKGDRVREALLEMTHAYTVMEDSLRTVAARKETAFKLFGTLLDLGTLRKEKVGLLDGFSRIQPVVTHIQEHATEPVNVTDLAALISLSASRLNVVFREIMGMAPMQYLQDLRHKKAVELLQDTGLSIGEIADKCGFCDQFEFSRQFKRKWGAPPKAYRKLLQEQKDFFG